MSPPSSCPCSTPNLRSPARGDCAAQIGGYWANVRLWGGSALTAKDQAPVSMFPPIADYGFLSNCEQSCLVAPDGSVEWLCLPRPEIGRAPSRGRERNS